MSTLSVTLATLTLGAGIAAAVVDSLARQRGYGALKMLASSGMLAFALSLGALDTAYGRVLSTALTLSWLGDFFLIGRTRRDVLAGLGAFLVAHLAYSAAFVTILRRSWPAAPAALLMATLGVAVLRWLRRAEIPVAMRLPVAAYLVAIAIMVTLAATTLRATVIIGAVAFAGSDLFVARQRFVTAAPINRLVGLPLYYAAQLLIAASLRAS